MMGKHIISKLKKSFSEKNKLFVLSMWKLTLGYGELPSLGGYSW
jgi:hypothetical protein